MLRKRTEKKGFCNKARCSISCRISEAQFLQIFSLHLSAYPRNNLSFLSTFYDSLTPKLTNLLSITLSLVEVVLVWTCNDFTKFPREYHIRTRKIFFGCKDVSKFKRINKKHSISKVYFQTHIRIHSFLSNFTPKSINTGTSHSEVTECCGSRQTHRYHYHAVSFHMQTSITDRWNFAREQ